MQTKETTYRQAIKDLKIIVDRLKKNEDMDVDDLVKDIGKAKELIQFCTGKVRKAKTTIEEIVSTMDPGSDLSRAVPERNGYVTTEPEDEDIPF